MIEKKVKPQLSVKEIENTFIRVKSKKDMKELMNIFELDQVKWLGGGNSLSHVDFWENYKENTCVTAYTFHRRWSSGFGFNSIEEVERNKNIKLILPQEFYEERGITPEKLNEINDYFK